MTSTFSPPALAAVILLLRLMRQRAASDSETLVELRGQLARLRRSPASFRRPSRRQMQETEAARHRSKPRSATRTTAPTVR